jgi:hypothetical protein
MVKMCGSCEQPVHVYCVTLFCMGSHSLSIMLTELLWWGFVECASTLTCVFMAWCLIKQRDNFTFLLYQYIIEVCGKLLIEHYLAYPLSLTHVSAWEQFKQEGYSDDKERIYTNWGTVNSASSFRWHHFTCLECRDLYCRNTNMQAVSCQTVKILCWYKR